MSADMVYIGLDLGQKQDPTAIAVVERAWGDNLVVRALERVALGTPYPRVVERVREIVQSPRLEGRCCVAADATSMGAPVMDLLYAAQLGCEVCAVTITSGASANGRGTVWNVPKRDLMAGLQVLLERGELRIARRLKEAGTLVRELLDIQMTMKTNGTRMGADGCGQHDDLAIAVALACWRAGRSDHRNGFGGGRLPGI